MDLHRHPHPGYASTPTSTMWVEEPEPHNTNPGGSKSAWAKLTKTWAFEFGGFVAGLLCLAATAALLGRYDNQLAPKWPVTLNFVLSFLGNVAFASTLFGVHASVAQSKWIWFVKRPRPMAGLATFQDARSGPLGAIQLLFTAGSEASVITASLAIVIGMFWGPFTQNLIHYESGNIIAAGETALLGRSVEYSAHGISVGFGRRHEDPFLELDIMSALVTAPNNDVNLPRFFCSTGNCTWAPIATLGFCSDCTDITSKIELACKSSHMTDGIDDSISWTAQTCAARLPGDTAGLYYIGTDEPTETLMNITQIGGDEGLRYHSIRKLPPDGIGSSRRPPVTKANFSATECSLSPCVLSLQASVRSGIYSETLLDTFTERPPDGTPWMWHKLQPPWGLERGIDPAANLSFGLNPDLYADWGGSGFLVGNKTIPGWVTTKDAHTGIGFCVAGPDGACTADPMLGLLFNANYTPSTCGSPNVDTFACAMGGIAAALTKTLRNAGVVANGTGVGDQFLVRGLAETAATFVRVQWGWIALPCIVWVLGLTAWAAVVLQTRGLRLPTWRDNPLPLVFLYREAGDRWGGDRLRDAVLAADGCSSWAYERVAKGMRVQLREVPEQAEGGGGVMRLVLTEKGGGWPGIG